MFASGRHRTFTSRPHAAPAPQHSRVHPRFSKPSLSSGSDASISRTGNALIYTLSTILVVALIVVIVLVIVYANKQSSDNDDVVIAGTEQIDIIDTEPLLLDAGTALAETNAKPAVPPTPPKVTATMAPAAPPASAPITAAAIQAKLQQASGGATTIAVVSRGCGACNGLKKMLEGKSSTVGVVHMLDTDELRKLPEAVQRQVDARYVPQFFKVCNGAVTRGPTGMLPQDALDAYMSSAC